MIFLIQVFPKIKDSEQVLVLKPSLKKCCSSINFKVLLYFSFIELFYRVGLCYLRVLTLNLFDFEIS